MIPSRFFSILLLALLAGACVCEQNPIFLDENFNAGTITVKPNSDLFYMLFESRSTPSEDPLLLWLNGGPGCSSLLGLFSENGPYWIRNDITLERNENSWNNNANVLYVDQPVGTGLSKASKSQLVHNEEEVGEDFYVFLVQFFDKYPQYKHRPFYLSGESYAGQYIPAIASAILGKANPEINLLGVAIGNGWVDPYYQQPAYATYAYKQGLISESLFKKTSSEFAYCQKLIAQNPSGSMTSIACTLPYSKITSSVPDFNVYDIRIPCQGDGCYEDSDNRIKAFITRADVQAILGVSGRSWDACVNNVNSALSSLHERSSSAQLVELLENNLKVLIYSGDMDFQCNYIGTRDLLLNLEWSGQADYQVAQEHEWIVDGQVLGSKKSARNLEFQIVYRAGHMVPMDQPESALNMINTFLSSSPSLTISEF